MSLRSDGPDTSPGAGEDRTRTVRNGRSGRRRGDSTMVVGRSYEFRVQPAISEKARDLFCDMALGVVPGGSVLRGTVMDDSHLHGILEQFRALGLTVLAAHPLDRHVGKPRPGDP